ncbi:hypothetical protein Nepgr_025121 [Nepenthes gracilis]|uniref:VAN3-binding protein-like auxin canalisation domain-containing protein n=1 Tax=Nepenthes gracilis TaxID=150966 RepID=A0AAD3XZE4_NEPGR|nr:hypothetical protein Nepgr_025121 [Nepenthes gracilis]
MDPDFMAAKVSEANPETMEFLSRAWCNFAVQAFRIDRLRDQSVVTTKGLDNMTPSAILKMEKGMKMEDDIDTNSIPSLQSDDLKLPWKTMPLKNVRSIKKWVKEIQEKRKEEKRMQRAEVHAAVSIAGLAAALAAIAAEKSKQQEQPNDSSRETAVASAAALVAAQCAKVAVSMGAKRQQLSSILGSAISGTSTPDILTLAAAATSSLRGASTLKARLGCRNRLNGSAFVLPVKDSNDYDFDFEKCRSMLAKCAEITIETSEGT